jgi:hypothetical protein
MAARFVSPSSGIGSDKISRFTSWRRVFVVEKPYEGDVSGSSSRHCRCTDFVLWASGVACRLLENQNGSHGAV